MCPISVPTSLFPGEFAAPRTEVLVDPALPKEFSFSAQTVIHTERVGQDILVVYVDRQSPRLLSTTDDVHLRLAEVADGTDDQIVEFVKRFGPIQARQTPPYFLLLRDEPDFPDFTLDDIYFSPPLNGTSVIEDLAGRLEAALDTAWVPPHKLGRLLRGFLEQTEPEPTDEPPSMLMALELVRWAFATRRLLDPGPLANWLEAHHQDVPLPVVETFSEMRFGALLVRDTIGAVRWTQGGEPPDWKAPTWATTDPPSDREHALVFACDVINRALLDYAPRLVPVPQGFDDNEAATIRAQLRPMTLLKAAFLGIALDLASGGSYRVCARPGCGKIFRVKRGGARFGQYRNFGSKYHSDDCQKLAGKERSRDRARRARTKT